MSYFVPSIRFCLSQHSCQRVFSTSNAEILKKKVLMPVFKKIHPDLFAQETKLIQKENLQCMQHLTEIMDSLDLFEGMMKSRSDANTVSKPLQQNYSLRCYIFRPLPTVNKELTAEILAAAEENVIEKPDEYVVEINFVFKSPSDVTTKAAIHSSKLSKSIYQIKKTLNEFFLLMKLNKPWPEVKSTVENDDFDLEGDPAIYGPSSDDRIPSMQQHQINVFEQIIKSGQSLSAYSAFSGNEIHKKRMRDHIMQVADSYIQRGNVFVKGLSTIDQVKALQRLRDFLADYGDLLNLTNPLWLRVIIIVHGPRPTVGPVGKSIPWTYKAENKHNRHIVEIPSKFKSKDLLSFLHKEVPGTFFV